MQEIQYSQLTRFGLREESERDTKRRSPMKEVEPAGWLLGHGNGYIKSIQKIGRAHV